MSQVVVGTSEQRQLIEAHLGLARALARTAVRRAPHLGYDELFAAGSEGLVRAARRYEPGKGVPFHIFAFKRVRGAILRTCRGGRVAWLEHALRAESDARPREQDGAGDPSSDSTPARPAPLAALTTVEAGRARAVTWAREAAASAAFAALCATPEALVADAEARARALAALRVAVAELAHDERRFVALYYERGATLEDVARELGVVKRTVQRLHDRVKARLAVGLTKCGVSEAPSAR